MAMNRSNPNSRHSSPLLSPADLPSPTSPPPILSPPNSPGRDHSSRNSYGLHPAWNHKAHSHSHAHGTQGQGQGSVQGPGSSSMAMSRSQSAGGLSSPGVGGPQHVQFDDATVHVHSGGLDEKERDKSFSRTTTMSTAGAASSFADGSGTYRRKVGFETFEPATDSALFSYTLQAKSDNYRRSRNTRVFQVAVSDDESGEDALDWLMESLVEDGDEIVAVRIIELDEGQKASHAAQEEFRDQAAHLLRDILEKNNEYGPERKISVIVEFVAGRVMQTVMRLIALYRPDSLIVGTRGTRSVLATWGKALKAPGMGSVSRYCVSHSPVPVIVVRPDRKVKKTLAKRQADPQRQQYADIVGGLELSRTRSGGERSEGGDARA